VPGMAAALRDAPAPVVGVSPIVGGQVVKGPTEPFLAWAGVSLSAPGIASFYGDLLDGLVADEPIADDALAIPTLQTDTLLGDPEARRRVAAEVLEFAEGLRR
jgi:LPPG:FO 2-phospho-L-lactate transferase